MIDEINEIFRFWPDIFGILIRFYNILFISNENSQKSRVVLFLTLS